MRKIFHFLAWVAAVAAFAGCDKVSLRGGGEVDAAFWVNLETQPTKAFSDGTLATELQVFVYSASKGFLPTLSYVAGSDISGHGALVIEGSASVNLKLVKGESYQIVFWAQKAGAPYTVDAREGTMTVTATGAANDASRDAFYKLYSTGVVGDAISQDILLKRPLAQINVFAPADDFAAAVASDVSFGGSSMTLTAPSRLNLLTGAVSAPVAYSFAKASIDPSEVTGLAGYKYVAMNYVLCGTSGTLDVGFSVYQEGSAAPVNSRSVPNVPFKANYRTNIVGNVFSVDGQFSVSIVPAYDTPDNVKTF